MSGGNGALIHDANLILLLSFNKKYRNSFIIAVIGSHKKIYKNVLFYLNFTF